MNLSDCTQIMDYLYEDDAARALFLLGERGVSGKTYILGSGIGRPLREYLEIIRNMVNPEYICGYGKAPYTKDSIRYLCADISELTEDTGWMPDVVFEEGIRRVIEAT
jgi:nucleoside-diphosphate-sugar epimerase